LLITGGKKKRRYDELSPGVIHEACEVVRGEGGFIFFDPGPRVGALLSGPEETREVFWGTLLGSAHCAVMTREEGAAVTGRERPEDIARALFRQARGTELEWVVVKLGGEGAVLYERGSQTKGTFGAPFK
jgi:sugar/nucleoside kinase (ribokinase family)